MGRRGLRGAVPYALTAFINKLGGSYSTADGKPGLSQRTPCAA